jgi:hypothetical protein
MARAEIGSVTHLFEKSRFEDVFVIRLKAVLRRSAGS